MFIGVAINLVGRLRSSTFSPASLFAASEQGVWYDPSDLTTLFQDTAGTTPVTATGQTVGLMLDKSKGLVLGSELVTNGDFSGGSTGWTPQDGNVVLSTSGGAGVATYSSTSTFYQGVSVQAGKTYRATAIIKRDSGSGTPFMNFRGGTTLASGTLGEFSGTGYASSSYVFASAWFVAASTTTVYLHFPCTAAATTVVSVDNISVKELPGFHATQATTASRPTYGINPITGSRNLLTRTEEFDNAAWVSLGSTTRGAASVTSANATSVQGLSRSANFTSIAGTAYTQSFEVKNNGVRYVQLLWDVGVSANFADFDLNTGEVTAGTYLGATITPAPDGYWRITLSSTLSASAFAQVFLTFVNSGSASRGASYTGNGTNGILIRKAQLELGSTATAYQRVTDQYNVTEAGVASAHYLRFDGAGDVLVSPTFTLTGAEPSHVFVGSFLNTTAQSNQGVVNYGSGLVNTSRSIGFESSSILKVDAGSNGVFTITFNPSVSNIFEGRFGPSVDSALNGGTFINSGLATGTNAGTYKVGLGILSTSPMHQMYGIIAVHRTLTTTERINTVTWLNGKTGAYT